MADYTLTPEPPLADYDQTFGDIHLSAPRDLAIVSIALPLGGEDAALKAIKSAYGVALPAIGKSSVTDVGGATLLRLATDQAFVLFRDAKPGADAVVADMLKHKVYVTDQTDVWCGLQLSGSSARAALERICPVDLHPSAFAVNDAARTVMEHLGVIIMRTGDDMFLLLSASSSAGSFLHAVETSIHNVTPA